METDDKTILPDSKILIVATNGFEQSELTEPRSHFLSAGAAVHVATPDGEDIRGWDENDWGEKIIADLKISDARVADYAAIILPGGQMNPDVLRTKPEVLDLIRSFDEAGKPVAAICHAPWLLIEAGLANGKTVTSYQSIKTDLKNAGANWVDEEVAVDDNLITSRDPDDLPAFCRAIDEAVQSRRSKAA